MDAKSFELLETLGSYSPTYLEMYINTDKQVDITALEESELATFFHEWIHFIQDLTTSFGCYNAYVFFEAFLSRGAKAIREGKEIEPPVRLDNSQNVFTNCYLKEVGWGTKPKYGFVNLIHCENEMVKVPDVLVTDASLKEFPHCFVTTDTGEVFELGALQLMESMAFLCQSYLFPKTEANHPVHPYHVASLVAELYSKEFASSVFNVIALCDASLMCSVPGVQFTSYLTRIRDRQIPMPTKPEEVYDYFLSNHNYMSSLQEIMDKTRRHFKGVLKDPVAFARYHKWIDNAFNQAIALRNYSPYFILELLKGGNLLSNDCFGKIFKAFGTPLIRNNKNEYSKYPLNPQNSDWDVEFMQPIKQIENILSGKECACSLKKWCMNSAEELQKKGVDPNKICNVDERCDANPSLRSLDAVHCPLGHVWYATGLPLMKSKS